MMSIVKDENSPYPMYSDGISTDGKAMAAKKQGTIATRVPYGRKRSCWKKKHSDDSIVFSSPKSSVGEGGIITCAICGVQRYYKFLKQTKKFGLPSCEPCRKFVSYTIACVRNGEHLSYSCVKKGPENCLRLETLPPNDGQPRSKKDALSNTRCRACWLNVCLETYQMPVGLRYQLIQFLSEDDRPPLSTSDAEMSYDDVDFNQLTKRKSQNNTEDKSCLKVLCDNFLKNAGLNEALRDKKKVVILRIKC